MKRLSRHIVAVYLVFFLLLGWNCQPSKDTQASSSDPTLTYLRITPQATDQVASLLAERLSEGVADSMLCAGQNRMITKYPKNASSSGRRESSNSSCIEYRLLSHLGSTHTGQLVELVLSAHPDNNELYLANIQMFQLQEGEKGQRLLNAGDFRIPFDPNRQDAVQQMGDRVLEVLLFSTLK